ncbi:hypothetical protein PV10_04803 [Exophiala mesophila]|uniref:Enoyl reductase (ER) domain-containing protein n=1 Tax=Exophiala mesophila TaxID=212818 RepID=A0A0D1XZD3_EXOME|nr:uncharacterized protein PV10_04803 [Exophiala mesophila]KIV93601.1 hypothetical protein PV10_04803 [Exophiala mesophila]
MTTNLPSEYKVARFEQAGGPLVIATVKLEMPKKGEILAKILASGVCHSDAIVQSGGWGNPFPIIPGHEAIGEVVAVGPDEDHWKVGDRVGGAWHGGRHCVSCRRGLFQACDQEQVNGLSRNGTHGEYAILRSEAAVSVPKDIDPVAYAPLLCAGVTVFNSLRQQKIFPGQTVAVQGLGGLGHLALQYTSKMGYRTIAISSSSAKKEFAHKLGAHEYIDASKGDIGGQLQKLGGASAILFTAPSGKDIQSLLGGLAPMGKLVILAAAEPTEINTALMIQKGLGIQAWPSGHSLDSEEAISFAHLHGVNCMVEKFPLDQANEALKHMLEGKVRFRGVLVP